MSGWGWRMVDAWGRGLGQAWQLKGRVGVAMLAMMMIWVVALSLQLGARNFARWQQAYRRGAAIVVYLQAELDAQSGEALAAELAALPGVERAEYVPQAVSEQRLRRALAGAANLLEGVEPNSLPASIELVLEPGMRDVVEISAPFQRLRRSGRIDDIDVMGEWTDKVGTTLAEARSLTARIATGALALACLLTSVLGFLMWRVDYQTAAVADLLGARAGYMRQPAMIATATTSVLAAIGAASVVRLSMAYFEALAPRLLGGVVAATPVVYLPMKTIAALLTLAALVGAGAGWLAGGARER